MSSILKAFVMAAVAATPVAAQAQSVRASSAVVAGAKHRAAAPVARSGAEMEGANEMRTVPLVLFFVGMGLVTAMVARSMRNSRSPGGGGNN